MRSAACEVLEEIVNIRDVGERGADLLDATERRLRFSFAALDDTVDHADEPLDELHPGHLEGIHCRKGSGATGVMRVLRHRQPRSPGRDRVLSARWLR